MQSNSIDYNWQDDAACKGMSMDSYDSFYVSTGKSAKKETEDVCSTCPVKDSCLNHALKYESYGYWAGTTSVDRKRMREELGIELVEIDFESMLFYEEEKAKHDEYIQSQKMNRGPKGPRKVPECGTRSGYNAHLRKKEPTCTACRAAQNESILKRKREKKAAQA
jgi:hypothetical protein